MMVIDAAAVRVWSDAKVSTARVERRQSIQPLPLSIYGSAVGTLTDLSDTARVRWKGRQLAVEH